MADTAQVAQSAFPILVQPTAPVAEVAQSVFLLILQEAPVVSCNNPPAGRLGVAYVHTFTATGGTAPYTWSISAGALPDGLTLDPSTGGVSGVPVVATTFSFTVTATDSLGAAGSVVCSITIGLPPLALLGGGGSHGVKGVRPSSCGCSPEILAAEKLRRLSVRKRAFPYRFLFPHGQTITVDEIGILAVPAPGSEVVVVSYTVPEGFRFIMQSFLADYSGGGAAFTAGDALWTLAINSATPNVQAMPIQGLTEVPVPLGSVAAGTVWPLPRPYEFAPLTFIQGKASNVNLAGGVFHSGLFGYLVPDVPK